MVTKRDVLRGLWGIFGAGVVAGELTEDESLLTFEQAAERFGEKATHIWDVSQAYATINLENPGRRRFRMDIVDSDDEHTYYSFKNGFQESLWSGEDVNIDVVYVEESLNQDDLDARVLDSQQSFEARLEEFGYGDEAELLAELLGHQFQGSCGCDSKLLEELKEAENTGEHTVKLGEGLLESAAANVEKVWSDEAGLENLSVNFREIDVDEFEEEFEDYMDEPTAFPQFITSRSTEDGFQGYVDDNHGYSIVTANPLLWDVEGPGSIEEDLDGVVSTMELLDRFKDAAFGAPYLNWLTTHENGHAIGLDHHSLGDGWMSYNRKALLKNVLTGKGIEAVDYERAMVRMLRGGEVVEQDGRKLLKVEKPRERLAEHYFRQNFEAYMDMLGGPDRYDIDVDIGETDVVTIKGPGGLEFEYFIDGSRVESYERV